MILILLISTSQMLDFRFRASQEKKCWDPTGMQCHGEKPEECMYMKISKAGLMRGWKKNCLKFHLIINMFQLTMGIYVYGTKWTNYLVTFICNNIIAVLLCIIINGMNLFHTDTHDGLSNFNRSWKLMSGRRNGDLKRKYEFSIKKTLKSIVKFPLL